MQYSIMQLVPMPTHPWYSSSYKCQEIFKMYDFYSSNRLKFNDNFDFQIKVPSFVEVTMCKSDFTQNCDF